MEKLLVLHNIRSALNVGSMFRTADAVGISKIYLTGYTPSPTDRFGRGQKDIEKAALGAEKNIPWQKSEDIFELISDFKKKNVYVLAIEQAEKSIDYKKINISRDTVFIVGNEVDGLSKEILKECDAIAQIPMKGKKESLNVSVALGVALFRILGV